MFRKELVLAAVVILAFWACDLQAAQIASTWVGGAQGEWGGARQWGDASNWDPAIVPDNNATDTFAVTIDGGAGIAQVHLQQNRTIDRLDCYGQVWMYMGVSVTVGGTPTVDGIVNPVDLTLNEPDGLTNYGEFELFIYGAQFSRIVGNITNHGVMDLESIVGYVKGNVTNLSGAELFLMNLWVSGTLDNSADGVIEIESLVDVGGGVENDGSIVVLSASELVVDNTFHNMGQIQLYGGACGGEEEGLFHNDVNGVIKGFGVVNAGSLLQNEGRIIASGGSLLIVTENNTIANNGILRSEPGCFLHVKPLFPGPGQADVNNTGRIEVKSGGGVTFYCDLLNQANGEIELLGGTLAATTIAHSAGATLEGFGNVAGDVIVEDSGIVKLTGSTNVVGDVTIGTIATLEISDGTTLITGHTTNNGTIHMKGGRVIPQGGLTNNGNIIWEPGTYNNIADFNLDGQVNFKDFADFAETWLWQAQL